MGRDDDERLTTDIIERARQYHRYGYQEIREMLATAAGALSTVLMLSVIFFRIVQKSLLSHADRFQTITGKILRLRVISFGQ